MLAPIFLERKLIIVAMVFYFFSHLVPCSPRVDGFVTMRLNFQSVKHVTSFFWELETPIKYSGGSRTTLGNTQLSMCGPESWWVGLLL